MCIAFPPSTDASWAGSLKQEPVDSLTWLVLETMLPSISGCEHVAPGTGQLSTRQLLSLFSPECPSCTHPSCFKGLNVRKAAVVYVFMYIVPDTGDFANVTACDSAFMHKNYLL